MCSLFYASIYFHIHVYIYIYMYMIYIYICILLSPYVHVRKFIRRGAGRSVFSLTCRLPYRVVILGCSSNCWPTDESRQWVNVQILFQVCKCILYINIYTMCSIYII